MMPKPPRTAGIRGLLIFNGILLALVVAGASVLCSRVGRALRRSSEERLTRDARRDGQSLDSVLTRTVHGVDSLARAEELVGRLRASEFQQASSFLTSAARWTGVTHVTCIDEAGLIVAASDPRLAGRSSGISKVDRVAQLRRGRGVMTRFRDDSLEVTTNLGDPTGMQWLLSASVRLSELLPRERWWAVIAGQSGEVKAARGRLTRPSIGLDDTPFKDDEIGWIAKRAHAVSLPGDVRGDRVWLVVAKPHELLYSEASRLTWLVASLATVWVLLVAALSAIFVTAHASSARRIAKRISDLENENEKLRVSRERYCDKAQSAVVAVEAKRDLLVSMGTELSEHVATMAGHAERLFETTDLPPSSRELAHRIVDRGSFLLEVLDDIIDYSKINMGTLDVRRQPCSVFKLIADVRPLVARHIDDKNLALQVEYITLIPETVHTDPTILRHIIKTLVNYAVYSTNQGNILVLVNLHRDEDDTGAEPQLEIHVMDTGEGMSTEERETVFEPFGAKEREIEHRNPASVLGLTVCKQQANLLGGDITVDAQPGKGTIFNLTIPTGSLVGVRMLESPVESDVETRPTAEPPTRDARVLLAEDNVEDVDRIRLGLVERGVSVTVVETGKDAIDALAGEDASFDVVLMDLQMPKMNGYQATRAIRKSGNAIPIVALISVNNASMRERCYKVGCDDFVSKTNSDAILEAIDNCVEKVKIFG